ncbi:MAG: sensor histidine kinase [Sarcina sp.]
MGIFEFGEKKKSISIFFLIFILGSILIFAANIRILNNINQSYIRENTAIIGTIEQYNPDIAKQVIPIITKGSTSNYELGKKVLDKYAYNSNISIFENPILENIVFSTYFKYLFIFAILLICIASYYLITMAKVWKNINNLNRKAEDIVNGKFFELSTNIFTDTSLDLLNVQFNIMQNRIKASLEALGKEKIKLKNIINDISHQFKTPIAAMTMYSDILKDADNMNKDEVDYFMNLTNEQISRMDWLVKTLLKYARLEGEVVEYKKSKQSLNDTVRECVAHFEMMAKEKEINLLFKDSIEEITFYHDRKWVQEAIMNIIKNALEHTDRDGTVSIKVMESEVFVRVEIEDNGEGIEIDEIPKIFERFHKGSNSINPTSIGIGLSLSKSIIEGNGGSITVKSTLGVGSNFIISFIK